MFKTPRLNLILILASMIFLEGCRSIPWPDRPAERCVMFINPLVIEGRTVWEGKCRCHDYTISAKILGRTSESVDHPVDYCKRLVGFRPKEWTDFFVSWFEEIQIWNNQNNKDLNDFVQ